MHSESSAEKEGRAKKRRYAYEKRCKCDDSIWVSRTIAQVNIVNWFLRWEHTLKHEAEHQQPNIFERGTTPPI